MNHRTILLALVALLAWLPAVGAAAAEPQASPATEPATFYVAPNGNDGWSGAMPAPVGSDGPLATLQAARDARSPRLSHSGTQGGRSPIPLCVLSVRLGGETGVLPM